MLKRYMNVWMEMTRWTPMSIIGQTLEKKNFFSVGSTILNILEQQDLMMINKIQSGLLRIA